MSGDMGTEEVANGVDQITSEHPYQIRDNLGLRPIRLTSHPSKVMQASEQDGVQLNISSTAES